MSLYVYLNVGSEAERGIQDGPQFSDWVPAKWSCHQPGQEVLAEVIYVTPSSDFKIKIKEVNNNVDPQSIFLSDTPPQMCFF